MLRVTIPVIFIVYRRYGEHGSDPFKTVRQTAVIRVSENNYDNVPTIRLQKQKLRFPELLNLLDRFGLEPFSLLHSSASCVFICSDNQRSSKSVV